MKAVIRRLVRLEDRFRAYSQQESTAMMRRDVSKRLERLEARVLLDDDPMVIHVEFVSPDGSVRDGPCFTVGGSRRAPLRLPARGDKKRTR
jgi:hypothetical protein